MLYGSLHDLYLNTTIDFDGTNLRSYMHTHKNNPDNSCDFLPFFCFFFSLAGVIVHNVLLDIAQVCPKPAASASIDV